MEIQVAEAGPCRRTLTVKLSPDDVRTHVDQMYESAASQVDLPGFRKGKVPRKVLEKKFGDEIMSEAKEHLIQNAFRDACREHEIEPIGRVVVDQMEELEVVLGSPFDFTIQVDIKPEFELSEVKGVEITARPSAPTDEDLDRALQQIADQKKQLGKVDGAVEENDFVKVDLTFQDESGAEVHKRQGVQLNTQIPVAGTKPEEFSAALIGQEVGAETTVELTFPDNFDAEAVRGNPGTVQVQILEVLRVAPPPIDDELAKGLDFDDLAALRENLGRQLQEEKERLELRRQEDEILQALAAEHAFELPESVVEDQAVRGLQMFEQRMREANVPDEEIEKKLEESKEEAHSDAQRRVRMSFLVDAVARKEKLFVTETDLDTEIRRIADENQVTPDVVREHLEKSNQMTDLRFGILERKVRDFLRENAKITDTNEG